MPTALLPKLPIKPARYWLRTSRKELRSTTIALTRRWLVERPALWSPESPTLYTAVSKVYEGNTLKDEYTTSFGIRTIEIIPNEGFFLNGKKTVFQRRVQSPRLRPLGWNCQ